MRCGTAFAAVAATSTTAFKCGPSPAETGQAVLLAAPAVMIASIGVQLLLLYLWRRRHDDVSLRWRPSALLLGLVTVPAVAVAALCARPLEWAGFAFWLFGCSYLSILLLSTRIWLIWDRRRAFTLAHLPPLLLLVAPALLMATGLWDGLSNAKPEDLFIYPGYLGWTTAPLTVALLLEAALRGRRRS